MMSDLSLAAALFHSLYLFRIRSAMAHSPIDGDQLGMPNRDDGTLTSAAELDFFDNALGKESSSYLLRPSPSGSASLSTTGCPVGFSRFDVFPHFRYYRDRLPPIWPSTEVRRFGTAVKELERLRAWLVETKCTEAVMENTGSYWKPVFNI